MSLQGAFSRLRRDRSAPAHDGWRELVTPEGVDLKG